MIKGALAKLKPFSEFARVLDKDVYVPLPTDWLLGVTDVVQSTKAIAEGRYKSVNMAGAAAISAVKNASGESELPFVFGGDGAVVAFPPELASVIGPALGRTMRWVEEELGLSLRAAIVPVADIRAGGRDVLVARYAVSDSAEYAMFTGGGVEWAEKQMKAGAYSLTAAGKGELPDLTGLSCRWMPMKARNGVILSLIARPEDSADPAQFASLVRSILELLSAGRQGHPVPESGPEVGWPPEGLDLEARASRGATSLFARKWWLRLETLFAWVLFRFRLNAGRFDPTHYRAQTMRNSDFRKYDDGLRMTVDCSSAVADSIEAELKRGQAAGVLRYGVHRQTAAIMTCIVPSPMTDDHIHFVDGADGGYARAARNLDGRVYGG